MNLTIDIGNSAVKAALFEDGRLVGVLQESEIAEYLPKAEKAIVVSVRGDVAGFEGALRFDGSTPVPVKNLYGTPGTLGYDRLAAAAGAKEMFPERAVLIVDFGTAITYDIVTAGGEFLGGNISPGAGCRFRALHDYTGSLPVCGLPEDVAGTSAEVAEPGPEFPARNTRAAIENGVVMGIIAETERYIELARKKFGEIEIIFTGGDADYFAGRVNFPIFAVPDLVFRGLNAILEHNGANL